MRKVMVTLSMGHGTVALLFSDHELPSIRRHELLRFWVADFQEIAWGGISCFKEKTIASHTKLLQAYYRHPDPPRDNRSSRKASEQESVKPMYPDAVFCNP